MRELLAGGIVALISYLSGFLLGRRTRSTTTRVQAVCPCSHHIGEHKEKTGRCMATKDGPHPAHIRLGSGTVQSWKQVPCTCVSYAGPELLSMFTPRDITDS